MAMSLRYHRVWLALGWIGVALAIYFSLIPQPPQPFSFQQGDKLTHALAYTGMMLWFCQLYSAPLARLRLALALIALGVSLELLQSLTPYRTCDVFDMLANASGVALGGLIAMTPLARSLAWLENRWLKWSA